MRWNDDADARSWVRAFVHGALQHHGRACERRFETAERAMRPTITAPDADRIGGGLQTTALSSRTKPMRRPLTGLIISTPLRPRRVDSNASRIEGAKPGQGTEDSYDGGQPVW